MHDPVSSDHLIVPTLDGSQHDCLLLGGAMTYDPIPGMLHIARPGLPTAL